MTQKECFRKVCQQGKYADSHETLWAYTTLLDQECCFYCFFKMNPCRFFSTLMRLFSEHPLFTLTSILCFSKKLQSLIMKLTAFCFEYATCHFMLLSSWNIKQSSISITASFFFPLRKNVSLFYPSVTHCSSPKTEYLRSKTHLLIRLLFLSTD